MAIYLVQHGEAKSKEEDPERPLSATGIKNAVHMANIANYYMIPVSRILHSDKLRSIETATIFKEKLNCDTPLEKVDGIGPNDDVIKFSENLCPNSNLMIVGHLPFLNKLASYLLTGSIEFPIFQFQNSGILCLYKLDDSKFWQIKWSFLRNIS